MYPNIIELLTSRKRESTPNPQSKFLTKDISGENQVVMKRFIYNPE